MQLRNKVKEFKGTKGKLTTKIINSMQLFYRIKIKGGFVTFILPDKLGLVKCAKT